MELIKAFKLMADQLRYERFENAFYVITNNKVKFIDSCIKEYTVDDESKHQFFEIMKQDFENFLATCESGDFLDYTYTPQNNYYSSSLRSILNQIYSPNSPGRLSIKNWYNEEIKLLIVADDVSFRNGRRLVTISTISSYYFCILYNTLFDDGNFTNLE